MLDVEVLVAALILPETATSWLEMPVELVDDVVEDGTKVERTGIELDTEVDSGVFVDKLELDVKTEDDTELEIVLRLGDSSTELEMGVD